MGIQAQLNEHSVDRVAKYVSFDVAEWEMQIVDAMLNCTPSFDNMSEEEKVDFGEGLNETIASMSFVE
jgi:hypothetical protein